MSTSVLIHQDFDLQKARACGSSGVVYDAVVKVADEDCAEEFMIEGEIYKRLGRHPRIVEVMIVVHGNCNILILERMSCSLYDYLSERDDDLPTDLILKWADQLAEAFDFIHEKDIYQVDVSVKNVLVDRNEMDLKLCDFAGSSIEGQEPMIWPKIRAHAPWLDDVPDVSTDIFSLGTLYYEMCTQHEIYPQTPENEIEELLRQGQLPDTSTLVLGKIIQKCWTRSYASAGEIRKDITALTVTLQQVPNITSHMVPSA